jgi:hypothetical protein
VDVAPQNAKGSAGADEATMQLKAKNASYLVDWLGEGEKFVPPRSSQSLRGSSGNDNDIESRETSTWRECD